MGMFEQPQRSGWPALARWMAGLVMLLSLSACTLPQPAPVAGSPAGGGTGEVADAEWKPYVLPGKRATDYRFTQKEGRWAIEARADGSASMLRRTLDVAPAALSEVTWSWWVDAPLPDADLADVDRTDSPASLVLAFDGDKSRLTARSRMMFDLARALTGEEPPYATLVYAWSTSAPVNSVVKNPRSDRIRKIVVDSGAADVKRWREHRRNVVADYQKAFGEPPGRLIGVAVMTDSDNTRAKARAWYGRIQFLPPAASDCVPLDGKRCDRRSD